MGLLHCTHILDYFTKKWPIFSMHEKVPQVAQTEKHGDMLLHHWNSGPGVLP